MQLQFYLFRYFVLSLLFCLFFNFSAFSWDSVKIANVKPLNAVFSSSSGTFAVGGEGTIISSGSSWQKMATGVTDDLYAVWGSSATDVYAVGGFFYDQYSQRGVVLHYDGTSWTKVLNIAGRLHGVWGSSSTDVFVVGEKGQAWHYDGSSWTNWRSPFDGSPLPGSGWKSEWDTWNFSGIWGSSPTNIRVVGGNSVLHYDGTTWSEMPGNINTISAIWDNLAVGPLGCYYQCNGVSWETKSTDAYANSIWKSYAVGNAVYRYTGSSWETDSSIEGSTSGIHGGGGNIYIVGATGPDGAKIGALWQGTGSGDIPPTTVATPDEGEYNSARNVTLTALSNIDGVEIQGTYYTIDGTTPTQSSTLYTTPLEIGETTTLKFFSVDNSGTVENIKTKIYTIHSTFENSLTQQGGSDSNTNNSFSKSEKSKPKIGLPNYEVNMSTLNLVLQGNLFWMKTKGMVIPIELTYNSDPNNTEGPFGKSWNMNFLSTIHMETGFVAATFRKGSGQVLTYMADKSMDSPATPIILTSPTGNHDTLTFNYSLTGSYFSLYVKEKKQTFRYDQGSNTFTYYLTLITDNNGNAITFDVDLNTGNLNKITDPSSRKITFTYLEGKCTKITPPHGTILFSYDNNGMLNKITDMEGYIANYTYDSDLYLTKMVTAGVTTDFYYKSRGYSGKYVNIVDEHQDGKRTYELDSILKTNIVTKMKTRMGPVYSFNNSNGLTKKITQPLGADRIIKYTAGMATQSTDFSGHATNAVYDLKGNVSSISTSVTLPTGIKMASNIATLMNYDAEDNLTKLTNPLSEQWQYTYDAKNNLTRVTSPMGFSSYLTYNSNGLLKTLKDPNGNVTTWTYDVYGNIATITSPVTDTISSVNKFFYTNLGFNCSEMVDPAGNRKYFQWDDNGRLTRTQYSEGILATYVYNYYNAFAQVRRINEKNNSTYVTRNRFDYITEINPPLHNKSYFYYDDNNNQIKLEDPLHRKTLSEFDENSNLIKTESPLHFKVYRKYDKNGKLIELKDQRNNVSKFTYDEMGNPVTMEYPESSKVTLTRDKLQRLIKETNGLGTVNYKYDKDGRQTEKSFTGASTDSYSYTYAPKGNMLSFTDPLGTTTYTYNKANKVSSITYPDGLSVAFDYNALAIISSISYPGGITASYTYNKRNCVPIPNIFKNAKNTAIEVPEKQHKSTSVSWDSKTMLYTYDATVKLTKQTYPSGLLETYSYDKNNRLLSQKTNMDETLKIGIDYTYNNGDETINVDYSGTLSTIPVTIDATASYNTANQITAWGGKGYIYDNNGNLTSGADTAFSASYDTQNRLIEMIVNGVVTTFKYNANGQRVQKISGSSTVNYHYDHQNRLLFTTDAAKKITTLFIYKGQRPIAMRTETGTWLYYHYNKTGNTLALTDENGDTVISYNYLPYGQKAVNGNDVGNPFTYVGAYGVIDDGENIYFMKNRTYDAVTAHFLQRDPIGFKGGVNLYRYAGGNPIDYIDPEGTAIVTATGAAIVTAAVTASLIYDWWNDRKKDVEKIEEKAEETNQIMEKLEKGTYKKGENLYKKWTKGRRDTFKQVGLLAGKMGTEAYGKMGTGNMVTDAIKDDVIDRLDSELDDD